MLYEIDHSVDNEGMKPQKVEITVTNRTILRLAIVMLVAYAGIRVILSLSHPITLILVAAFLAMALNPAVHWISERLGRRTKRTVAIALAFLLVIGVVIGFFSLVLPPLVGQVGSFIKQIPATVQNLKTQDSTVGRAVRHYGLDSQIDNFSSDFSSRIGARPVLATAGRIGGTLVSTLAVLAMTFMMLNEGPIWFERFMSVQPAEKRQHRRTLVRRMYSMVTGYVNGQFIMATIAGAFCLVALLIGSSVFHVSINAVALAGILAIFALIPMIGNPIGSIFVVLGCLLTSLNLAIVMVIYFLIYFQIENMTLQPYVQSRQNELTPLIVFVSALLGISFGGILGALFAIPVAGCLRILLIDWAGKRGYLKIK